MMNDCDCGCGNCGGSKRGNKGASKGLVTKI